MAKDAQNWVTNCRRCQIARGDYNQPKPKIGHLEAHNPLDLVCLDFTKIDPSKTGKENVLVNTDAFTKFSLAVCTPNQTAKTVPKILVEKWFHVYGVPSRIHSDQGRCFDSNNHYRLGTVNSNTVNSKFHLIRSFFEIFARFLSFHV